MKKRQFNTLSSFLLIMLIMLIIIPIASFAEPASLNSLLKTLSADEKNTLTSGTPLTSITNRKDRTRLQYTPNIDLFDEAAKFASKSRPQILYENLFFLPVEDSESRTDLMLFLSNKLRDIPGLANIEYKNLKDGNVHPIFKSSAAVKSGDNLDIIAPPSLLNTFPKSKSERIYVLQNMPPFDNVSSRYRYEYKEYYSSFIGNNISDIKYSNIRAVKSNDMFTSCWIIETDKGILLYGVGAVKISGFASIFGGVIENSFTSRMVGLFEWLNEELRKRDSSQNAILLF